MTTRSNFLGRSMLKDSMKIYFAFFDFPTNFYAFLNLDLIPGIYRNLKYKRKTKSSRWAIFGPLAGRLTGCAACQPSLDRLHPWRAGPGVSGRWIEAEAPPSGTAGGEGPSGGHHDTGAARQRQSMVEGGHSPGGTSGGGAPDGGGCNDAAALRATMGATTWTGGLGKRSATAVATTLEGKVGGGVPRWHCRRRTRVDGGALRGGERKMKPNGGGGRSTLIERCQEGLRRGGSSLARAALSGGRHRRGAAKQGSKGDYRWARLSYSTDLYFSNILQIALYWFHPKAAFPCTKFSK
jgi:hypothetical protein